MKKPEKFYFSLFLFAIFIVLLSACSDSDDSIDDEVIEEDSWRIKEIQRSKLGNDVTTIRFYYQDDKLDSIRVPGYFYDYGNSLNYGFTSYASDLLYLFDYYTSEAGTDISIMDVSDGKMVNKFNHNIKFEDGVPTEEVFEGEDFVQTVTYTYDATGQIDRIVRENSSEFYVGNSPFTYVRTNNAATHTVHASNNDVVYEYEYFYEEDLLTEVTIENPDYPDSGWITSYEYDNNDRLIKVVSHHVGSEVEYVYDIIYDDNNNPVKITHTAEGYEEGEFRFTFEKGKTNFNYIPLHESIYYNNLINGVPWFWIFD